MYLIGFLHVHLKRVIPKFFFLIVLRKKTQLLLAQKKIPIIKVQPIMDWCGSAYNTVND